MFRHGMKESESRTVHLSVAQEWLKIVFEFAYLGRILLNSSNIMDIFAVAHYLQMDSLLKACTRFIRK